MNTRLALHILSPDIIREIYARSLAIIYLSLKDEGV